MFGFGKKRGRISFGSGQDIEVHEIFYDSLAQKHEEQLNVAERRFEISIPKGALRLPFVLACAFFVLFALRVVQLQAVEGKEYMAQAEQNKYLFSRVQSDRGIIYDSNFKPLVQNLSTFDLECVKFKMPKEEAQRTKIIESIAGILNRDVHELAKSINNNKIPTVENLDHQALIVMEARIADFPGCTIAKRPIRNYVADAGLSHLLGYMGKIDQEEWWASKDAYSVNDYIGRSGLEKSYESVLRKDPGKVRLERDAKGNIISKDIASPAQSGDSIQLWLDLDLQKKIADSLGKQLVNLGLKKASAVAIDPNTGGILAMVSFPNYDNNAFSKGDSEQIQKILGDPDHPLYNRPISGQYLTGSTIKPLEAAAALQEKLIKPEKKIDCRGELVIPNKYNPEDSHTFHDNHIHGMTDMYKAIAESCNVYFWTIGGGWGNQQGLGPTRIKKYLELFGWTQPTGIDLPGELPGFVPDPDWKKQKFAGTQDQSWGDGDTYNMSIGQGFVAITPLEVANSYAAIANGGTLYKPQMVKKIVNAQREVVEEKQPQIIRQNFIDAENLAAVREGMRHGVNGAGAPLASSLILNQLRVPMGSKTGTAQVRKGADGKDILYTWTSVFAPYDKPQIVLTVMIEDVREGQFAVLPVMKDILGWYFTPEDQRNLEAPAQDQAPEATAPLDQQQIQQQLQQIQDQVNQLQNGSLPITPANDASQPNPAKPEDPQ